ncbi:hypothetical protein FHX37_4019 [Haloactinospora alba]|uniref:Sulfotransferase family protein n=1 Tax=Haloactinospora alba TaxID=405555 RepID=A0A543NA17_9ACTN|nr:hypothetical protein [Haloactinospora alba]TQN28660.1 hypothetical protein FHX37_4019 [Haloactinospora alba]
MVSGVTPLPGDARILHVGPHKSGTTALQGAFHLARPRLAEQGITHVGKGRNPARPVQAVTGRPPMLGGPTPHEEDWQGLVDEVAATGDQRALISSEFFAAATEGTIPRIVEDLGGSRVHVVVTLRPLGKVLPAQWQQYVQNGIRASYEEWLDVMFNRPHERPNSNFWQRHQQGDFVERWAGVVGADNLTVIPVDDSDRGMLLRVFEGLLDLPEGFLVPDDRHANRSLSYGEAETLRGLNKGFKARRLPASFYSTYIRHGAVKRMKVAYQPPKGSEILTPEWALERAAKLGADSAERISALGVNVIGDLERLSDYPSNRAGTPASGVAVPPEAAAQALVGAVGAIRRGGVPDPAPSRPGPGAGRDRRLRETPARELARELFSRGLRRARRVGGRLLGRGRSASS